MLKKKRRYTKIHNQEIDELGFVEIISYHKRG